MLSDQLLADLLGEQLQLLAPDLRALGVARERFPGPPDDVADVVKTRYPCDVMAPVAVLHGEGYAAFVR